MRDENTVGILTVGILALIIGFGVFMASEWLFNQFTKKLKKEDSPRSAFIQQEEIPPKPRLQLNPQLDLAELLQRTKIRLTTFGRVNGEKGEEWIHIPIEDAINLVVEEENKNRKLHREPQGTATIPSTLLPINLQGVGITQKLGAQIPLELTFYNERGIPIRLSEIIHDKPVILTFAYYTCPHLCTLVLNGVMNAILGIQPLLGKDFLALTVSINPKDRPDLALTKKQCYLSRYFKARNSRIPLPEKETSWRFLIGNEDSIRKLSDAVGFSYALDSQSGQYSHASAVFIVTPTGKVSQYLLGINYSPNDLSLALKRATTAEIGTPFRQLLLYCFHYDPMTGKQTLRVLNLLKALAAVTTFGIMGALFRVVRSERSS